MSQHCLGSASPTAVRSSISGAYRRSLPRSWAPRIYVIAAFFLLAVPLQAQKSLLDLRFLELSGDGDRTYHNFIYSRTFSDGPFSLESFWLFLPQEDEYKEIALGLGYRAATFGQTILSLIGYLSSAPDDEYFEPALVFSDTEGRLTWSLFLLHYFPLGTGGIHQWLIDPAEVQYSITRRFAIGISGYFYRPQAGNCLTKIGPKVNIADELGASELALRLTSDDALEVQLRRIFYF